MKELVLSHVCEECEFFGNVVVPKDARVVVCPVCETENDFWLEGEMPPVNHRN